MLASLKGKGGIPAGPLHAGASRRAKKKVPEHLNFCRFKGEVNCIPQNLQVNGNKSGEMLFTMGAKRSTLGYGGLAV